MAVVDMLPAYLCSMGMPAAGGGQKKGGVTCDCELPWVLGTELWSLCNSSKCI